MLYLKETAAGMVQMVDTFAKPKMCLLVDVIQWFLDQKITYEPQSIYEDVQVSNGGRLYLLITLCNSGKH